MDPIIIIMIRSIFYKLIRRKGVLEGRRIKLSEFRGLPFNNRVPNLVKMFELKDWFIQNSPNYRTATKYTTQIAELHQELNYQTARIALSRIVLFLGAVVLWGVLTPEGNPD
jgi:hypothetical protein